MFNAIAGDSLVVAILGVGVLTVLVVAAAGWKRSRNLRPALWTGLVITLAMIGLVTLGSVVMGPYMGAPGVNLVPFQEIQRGLNYRGTAAELNLVGNIALFMPLGVAIACLAHGGFWARWALAIVSGLVLSAAIEVTQYSLGRVADIDDVILNTSGALAGGLVGALIGALVARNERWLQ